MLGGWPSPPLSVNDVLRLGLYLSWLGAWYTTLCYSPRSPSPRSVPVPFTLPLPAATSVPLSLPFTATAATAASSDGFTFPGAAFPAFLAFGALLLTPSQRRRGGTSAAAHVSVSFLADAFVLLVAFAWKPMEITYSFEVRVQGSWLTVALFCALHYLGDTPAGLGTRKLKSKTSKQGLSRGDSETE